MPEPGIEPPFNSPWADPCDIRGCERPAEWRLLGTAEGVLVGFCRYHRDLIEDDGLELIEDG